MLGDNESPYLFFIILKRTHFGVFNQKFYYLISANNKVFCYSVASFSLKIFNNGIKTIACTSVPNYGFNHFSC